MQLPKLKQIARKRSTITAFGGYQHLQSCAENAFYNETNLSSRNYPALSPRLPRTLAKTLTKPNGLYAKNGLIWVDGTTLYYNGTAVGTVTDCEKTFCGIGSKVLVWPDKKYLDTQTNTLQSLGATWESTENVRFAPSFEDGSEYVIKTEGETPPEEPENGEFWLDTSGEQDVLRVYATATETWGAVPTTYVKISAANLGAPFARYDVLHLSGIAQSILGQNATTLNGVLTAWDVGEDYVVVSGLLAKAVTQTAQQGTVVVAREIPDLDFIVQSDNRVWGCSNATHAIYASKLGDPTNWESFMGIASDSYQVTVGSDGNFTAAATAMGYLLFFKENLIHKVYGTKPENYQVTTISCSGVQNGCAKSLATVNETLYYKTPQGVVAYDGGLPVELGEVFGDVLYANAVGGANMGCYYLSAQDSAQQTHLFCYDAVRGIWHREDNLQVQAFAAVGTLLYALTTQGELWVIGQSLPSESTAAQNRLQSASVQTEPSQTQVAQLATTTSAITEGEAETDITWSAETGEIGLYTHENKTVSKIELRLEAEQGARVLVEAQYNSSGQWERLAEICVQQKQMALVPIIPRRFDHMRLRYSGQGEVCIYSITKLLEQGSELTWQT